MILKIIIILLIIALIIFLFYIRHCKKFTLDRFNVGNCIVFGAKGKGKDLLFQWVIFQRSKQKKTRQRTIAQLSNIDYGYNTRVEKLSCLNLDPNDYNSLLNDTIVQVPKVHEFENVDYFLSDGGIYLPAQYDNILSKLYPSFPIYYATSRHLYNSNVHINTQALNRPWLKIREQADSYFYVKKKIKLLFGFFIVFQYYEKYSSAEQRLEPLTARLLNGFSKAEADKYECINGKIKPLLAYIPERRIKYDTRIFEKVFFNNLLQ